MSITFEMATSSINNLNRCSGNIESQQFNQLINNNSTYQHCIARPARRGFCNCQQLRRMWGPEGECHIEMSAWYLSRPAVVLIYTRLINVLCQPSITEKVFIYRLFVFLCVTLYLHTHVVFTTFLAFVVFIIVN